MPLYDFRCPEDHMTERLAGFHVSEVACPVCGLPARRLEVNLIQHNGFAAIPTKERYVNLNRAVEAQHELVYEAEKNHAELPDLWQIAKDRVASGAVKAIE